MTMRGSKQARAGPPRIGRARVSVPRARAARCRAAAPAKPDSSTRAGTGGDVYDAVIVGAGISGLTTGLALQTKHSGEVGSFLITEARERVGGNITSCSDGDYVWEEGPNSCTPSDSVLEAAVRRTRFRPATGGACTRRS